MANANPQCNFPPAVQTRLRDLIAVGRYRAFLKSPHGQAGVNNQNWVGGWGLGQGGMGSAGLWVKQNSNGEIIDRLVTKETVQRARVWNRADNWVPVGSVGVGAPREAFVHNVLTRRQFANYVRHMGHRVYQQQNRFRTYMEFCPHGSLLNLISAHQFACEPGNNWGPDRLRNRGAHQARKERTARQHMIPEPFVWYLFKSLAQAAADAESNINGAVGGAPAQYVHQDIKPSNIFLAEPDASGFKTYPVPKLGDFDSGRLTSQADLPNPANWTRDGRTPHFTAPEQDPTMRHLSIQRLSPMNIWQIGQTLRAIIGVVNNPDQPVYTENGGVIDSPEPDAFAMNAFMDGVYCEERLVPLIQLCLANMPQRRPRPAQILQVIETARQDGRFDGMDTYGQGRLPEWRASRYRLKINMVDRYELGLSLRRRRAPKLVLPRLVQKRGRRTTVQAIPAPV